MERQNLIIAGERRAGTTSLHQCLKTHPELYLIDKTDMNYFVDEELLGREEIIQNPNFNHWSTTHSRESYQRLFSEAQDRSIVGHKGADLFYWRPSHARIKEFVPNVRLIVLMRDPIERAWSHYWNEVGKGRERLSFPEAIAAESERSAQSKFKRYHLSYIQRGMYADSLRTLQQTFAKEQILVVITERLWTSLDRTLPKIYHFLGVSQNHGIPPRPERQNSNWTMLARSWAKHPQIEPMVKLYERAFESLLVRSTTDAERRRKWRQRFQLPFRKRAKTLEMDDETRDYLRRTFAAQQEDLEELLGEKIPEWQS